MGNRVSLAGDLTDPGRLPLQKLATDCAPWLEKKSCQRRACMRAYLWAGGSGGYTEPGFAVCKLHSLSPPRLHATGEDAQRLIPVSSTYPFPFPRSPHPHPPVSLARFPSSSLSPSLSLLVCTRVSTASAGEEPAAALSPSRLDIKH